MAWSCDVSFNNVVSIWNQVDVSGRCAVEYKVGKDQVTRVKFLESCKTAETGFTTLNPVSNMSPFLYLFFPHFWKAASVSDQAIRKSG